MAVVINPAGIQALLQSPGVQREIAAKTDLIAKNAFDEAANIIPGIRGSQVGNPIFSLFLPGEGHVWVGIGNYKGKAGRSAAEFLSNKQMNPKEGPGKGWFTKAILGDDPLVGLTPTGFRLAEGA